MSDPVVSALLEIKGDIGKLQSSVESLNDWLRSHTIEDAAAHQRITDLEMAQAQTKGSERTWKLVAIGGGSIIGYAVEAVLSWLGHKP